MQLIKYSLNLQICSKKRRKLFLKGLNRQKRVSLNLQREICKLSCSPIEIAKTTFCPSCDSNQSAVPRFQGFLLLGGAFQFKREKAWERGWREASKQDHFFFKSNPAYFRGDGLANRNSGTAYRNPTEAHLRH